MLRRGNSGTKVRAMQRKFKDVGYYIITDGIFGQRTDDIVRGFQSAFSLVIDGVFGPVTSKKLNEILALKNTARFKNTSTKHFKQSEFNCRHCNKNIGITLDLLLRLELLRYLLGNNAIVISSGYRCHTHNRNVGGAANSTHLRGIAADIRVANNSIDRTWQYAIMIFHDGGVSKYTNFVHVDVRGHVARW